MAQRTFKSRNMQPSDIFKARGLKRAKKPTKPFSIWSRFPTVAHSFVPADTKLVEKLGFAPGERIHFFAGYVGGWASELARQGLRVTFTDISLYAVHKAKEVMRTEGLYEKVLCKEAGRYPRKPLQYDWNFSFEPMPVLRDNPVAPILRGLLNRKGYKIAIYGAGWHETIIAYAKQKIAPICRLYGADLELSFIDIRGIPQGEKEAQISKHLVVTIRTNDEARRKAWIDLLLIKRIRFLKSRRRICTAQALKADEWIEKRFRAFNIPDNERGRQIDESLARLKTLKNIDPNIFMR